MQRSWIAFIKIITFIVAAILSALLSMNMFVQLSFILFWDKILLGIASLIFETSKIFCLIQGGELWERSKNKKYSKKQRINFKAKSIRKFIIYLALALIAIISSFGFTLTTLAFRTTMLMNTSNYDKIIILNNDITDNKNQIDKLNQKSVNIDIQLSKLNPTYIENSTDSSVKDSDNNTNKSTFKSKKLDSSYVQMQQTLISKQTDIELSIKDYKNENTTKQTEIEKLKELESKKDKSEETQDMFSLIADTIKIDKKLIIFIILLFISLVLEVLLFTLSFDNDLLHKKDSDKDDEDNDRKNKKIKKINNMIKETNPDFKNLQVKEIEPIITVEPINEVIDLKILETEKQEMGIEESMLKFLYNKIYFYVREQLRILAKLDSSYHEIDFCTSNIVFDTNDDIVQKYINYLSYKGIIIKSEQRNSIYYDKTYYKLKLFKDFDELLKRRVR